MSLRVLPRPTAAATLMFVAFVAIAINSMVARGADEKPQTITHRITGLCCPEREPDLREALADNPKVKLISIDYAHAEATFSYDPATFSAENLRGTIARRGFGIKPPTTVPADKLTLVEIPIVGLDCKGCCLGTYNVIIKIDGVEQATVSYKEKENRVRALIDPARTSREALEDALKKAHVTLQSP